MVQNLGIANARSECKQSIRQIMSAHMQLRLTSPQLASHSKDLVQRALLADGQYWWQTAV